MKQYLGIDLGGTTIKYGLLDDMGKIKVTHKIKTPTSKIEIEKTFSEIIARYENEIVGVGISAPGIIDRDGLMITAGSILSLYGVNLKKDLEKTFSVPITITNDGNCATIAEHWLGNAKDSDNYLCVVLGTGVGAGIVLNGKLVEGFNGLAGELGWTLMDEYKSLRDIEEISANQKCAVVLGLLRKYNLENQKIHPKEFIDDPRIIFTRRREKEQLATTVLSEFFRDISTMLLNICVLLDPDKILIGGGISENREFFSEILTTFEDLTTKHRSVARIRNKISWSIVPTSLGNQAGLIGAVYQSKQILEDKK